MKIWDTQKYLIKKGKHASLPLYRKIWLCKSPNRYKYRLTFTESCQYNLRGVDQYDWNKLIGVSKDLINNHNYSIMAGWRYNLLLSKIELCMYVHNKDVRTAPEGFIKGASNAFYSREAIMSLNATDTVECTIVFGEENWVVILTSNDKQAIQHFPIPEKVRSLFAREIPPYFGGNKPAPNDIIIYR